MARPRMPEGEARGIFLRIRLNAAERARLDRAAAAQKAETSTWAREQLLALADVVLRKKRRSGPAGNRTR
jgi:hypothetical protein